MRALAEPHMQLAERSPVAFDELMPKTLATATVDRLMHHAHVCQTAGDSIRLSQALAGKGVIPLSS
jgi:DNA replication protein DnaC